MSTLSGGWTPLRPLRALQDTRVATREESGVLARLGVDMLGDADRGVIWVESQQGRAHQGFVTGEVRDYVLKKHELQEVS